MSWHKCKRQAQCCTAPLYPQVCGLLLLQDGAGGMSNLPTAGAKSGGYVPPSLRNRAPGDVGDSMNKRREENSVRVTNLSEDTREDDLRVCAAKPLCKADRTLQHLATACIHLMLQPSACAFTEISV